jgi:hypothetical protein
LVAIRVERLSEGPSSTTATLAAFVESLPEELDRLAPEDHHRIYKMLRLRVEVGGDGRTEIGGSFTGGEAVRKNGGTGW